MITHGDIETIDFPEDPERCQGMASFGQCRNKGIRFDHGTVGKFCKIHKGTASLIADRNQNASNYLLTKYQARLQRHATSPNIKSLRDEVGILRMMLEERLNRCGDDTDLMIQAGPISDLVVKVEKVVSSCHKLEGSMGQLLDKQAILQFANEMVSVIGSEVTDPAVLDRIMSKLMSLMGRIGEKEEDESL
jgi:hypothetical protein